MAIELHVLADARLLETFRLESGMHVLGSSAEADLLLSTRDVTGDLCRVDLGIDGEVTIRTLDGTALRHSSGAQAPEVVARNGDFAEIGALRLLVLDRAPRLEVQVAKEPQVPKTAPSKGMRPAASEPLALRVRADQETRVVAIDQPMLTFGRGPGNTISFPDPEVSRHHARLIQKPDGPWIEDLGSTHGTSLDGIAVKAAAWPVGAQVRLTREPDAPTLELMTLVEAFAEPESDEALTPLRGKSGPMQLVRRQVLRYGAVDDTLLVLGETGTGKELVARALARLRGAQRPFQALNCGNSTEGLLESRLFGYRKGAFTGAVADRVGDLEAAADGTVFLDEIGDMPLDFQVRLLRVLESRELQRLGDTQIRPFRARVVAATHRDLGAMVAAGEFREDLYHRIAVLDIRLPPLRDRLEDLPALARVFLSARRGLSAGKTLSDAALEKLEHHRWPGNVRELRNVIDRAAVHTDSPEIGPEAIVFSSTAASASTRSAPQTIENLPAHLDSVRSDWCRRALAEAHGNVSDAARALGLNRSTYRSYLVRYGISAEDEAE